MSFNWKISEMRGLAPEETHQRPLKLWASATADNAETATIEIPTDHFIHSLLLRVAKGTVASARGTTLADGITTVRVIGDGNKYYKKLTGGMAKQVSITEKEAQSTGFYKIYFSSSRIKQAQPLPAWIHTSATLEIDLATGGATYYNSVDVTLIESFYKGQDLTNWKILIEKYLVDKNYGTATGEQEYRHERAYTIFGYIYEMDDNGTLSDTAFDYLILKAISSEGEHRLVDKMRIEQIREANQNEYQQALDTGYAIVEFPQGFSTHRYTSLYSFLNIATAGTDVGLKVLERYVL